MRILLLCSVGLAAFSCGTSNSGTSDGGPMTGAGTCQGQPFGIYRFESTYECPEGTKASPDNLSITFIQGDGGQMEVLLGSVEIIRSEQVSQKDCLIVVTFDGGALQFKYFGNDTLELVGSSSPAGKCLFSNGVCIDEAEPLSCQITGSK